MIKHIAVALDGSANAAAAADLANLLAGRLGAKIRGVHVVDAVFLDGAFITDISGAMGFEPFLNLQAQMRTTLDDLAKLVEREFVTRCNAAGVPHEFVVERSGVVPGVLSCCRFADLLVVGQRGVNSRHHPDALGSVAAALLRRSAVPVLVVPEGSRPPSHPMAAYDGSLKALQALRQAAELCRALALPLAVVTVDTHEERGNRLLQDAARYLEPFAIEVRFELLRSEAVEQALLAAVGPSEYDLVFLGAHGHGRIVELVLGSTSDYLASRSGAPVWCVTHA
jgi:nucleotide-binding universal stress UspA family protein